MSHTENDEEEAQNYLVEEDVLEIYTTKSLR